MSVTATNEKGSLQYTLWPRATLIAMERRAVRDPVESTQTEGNKPDQSSQKDETLGQLMMRL